MAEEEEDIELWSEDGRSKKERAKAKKKARAKAKLEHSSQPQTTDSPKEEEPRGVQKDMRSYLSKAAVVAGPPPVLNKNQKKKAEAARATSKK